MATHHSLDIKTIPEKVLYINETELADLTVLNEYPQNKDASASDNIRVYVPLDLNHDAIIRRLRDIYFRYGDPTEANEFSFRMEVERIIAHLEIYDQVWYVRQGNSGNGHSKYATELVQEIIGILEENEGCAELFPYETIEQLRADYGLSQELE